MGILERILRFSRIYILNLPKRLTYYNGDFGPLTLIKMDLKTVVIGSIVSVCTVLAYPQILKTQTSTFNSLLLFSLLFPFFCCSLFLHTLRGAAFRCGCLEISTYFFRQTYRYEPKMTRLGYLSCWPHRLHDNFIGAPVKCGIPQPGGILHIALHCHNLLPCSALTPQCQHRDHTVFCGVSGHILDTQRIALLVWC